MKRINTVSRWSAASSSSSSCCFCNSNNKKSGPWCLLHPSNANRNSAATSIGLFDSWGQEEEEEEYKEDFLYERNPFLLRILSLSSSLLLLQLQEKNSGCRVSNLFWHFGGIFFCEFGKVKGLKLYVFSLLEPFPCIDNFRHFMFPKLEPYLASTISGISCFLVTTLLCINNFGCIMFLCYIIFTMHWHFHKECHQP